MDSHKIELAEIKSRELLEFAPDSIIIVNANGCILLLNTQAEKMFGYYKDELIGKPIETLMPERFREVHQGHRADYYTAPRTRLMGAGIDLYGLRKDGREFPIDIRLAPLMTEEGLTVICDIRDLTGASQMHKELEIKSKQLEAVSKAMSSFLEKGNWKETSAMILNSALSQTESEYGFIGVVMEGPVLRVFSIEGIIWDENIGRELYENAVHTFNEVGYLDFPNMDNLFGRVITSGKVVVSNDPGQDPRSGGRRPAGHPALKSFLGVPIMHGTDVVGMIGVANRHGGYSGAERSRIEILCRAASVLYDSYLKGEKEKLLEEERRRTEKRLVVQYAITRVLAESATLSDAIPKIIQAICETTGWDMGAIWTIDRQANLLRCLEHWHLPSVDFREFEEATRRFTFAPGVGMPGRIWDTSQPVWIVDVTQDTNFPRAPYAAGAGLHSALGFPIKFGDEFLGVIEFLSREICQSDEAMLQMFAAIGSQIGQFMVRKDTETDLKKNYSLLHSVIEGTTDAVFVKDLKGRYLMINPPGARLIGRPVEEVVGRDDTALFVPEAAGQIMEDDRRVIHSGETRTYEEELLASAGIKRTYLTTKAPFLDHQGEVVGIIGIARDITERKEAEEQIHHLAYYDLLTGLPNRLMFRDSIDRAITEARQEIRSFAILVINLNRFKEINNTLGYQNGDVILRQIGECLQGLFKGSGLVSRLGGDEFGLLLGGKDAGGAAQSAGMIKQRLEEPFSLEGLSLDISAGIGISLFPGHGEDADTLIRRAYIAMHRAKTTESGSFVYTPESDRFIPERLALMGDLRSAIGLNQLFLLYQPKIDLKTGRSLGVESLVRWKHPKSGLIPPDKFISLAEESGLIKQLTFWVLKEALRQSRSWKQTGLEISVAVNLSVRSLQAPQLLDQIKGLLSTWGVSPTLLRFEITESIIMSDPELALEIITQLTLMGIRFSIDDFGTGYSSLRYLQRLPVDEIKIDKSFVMNMMEDENNMKIVRSTIELGHSLGLKVVAEGVENQETMERLSSLGCDAAQGYFISRPIPHAELTAWLSKKSTGS